jgi:hypothetical protein
MTTTRGSAHYTGLLPVRLTTLENERFPTGQLPFRKRASRGLSSLIAFCAGVAATFAWWSYGNATRQVIANSYPQLGWLAPKEATVHTAPDTIAPTDAPNHQQLDAMLGDDLHAMRLSLDRIVAGQELITRSIDEIAARVAAGQEQMTHSTDQTATGAAAGQEPTTGGSDQTVAAITIGQGQIARNIDQTATSVDQAPSARASSITVESRGDGASLQPTARLNITPTEAKPTQTSSERGKQLPAASGHDASCFPSAAAVLQNHPGSSPSWTLRAPGHEGSQCWRAAARPSGSDHRSQMVQRNETVGTTANELSAPPAPYSRPPE